MCVLRPCSILDDFLPLDFHSKILHMNSTRGLSSCYHSTLIGFLPCFWEGTLFHLGLKGNQQEHLKFMFRPLILASTHAILANICLRSWGRHIALTREKRTEEALGREVCDLSIFGNSFC